MPAGTCISLVSSILPNPIAILNIKINGMLLSALMPTLSVAEMNSVLFSIYIEFKQNPYIWYSPPIKNMYQNNKQQIQNQQDFTATAFLSCSLRQEDRPFVNFVEKILKAHYIKPIGTVGYYSSAPTSTAEHMKKNIPKADFVVIVATPRYIQKDINSGKSSQGISEMLHVGTGMAHMADKPVVVFVQEGTNVGNFLPTITQYVTLNGQLADLNEKWIQINSLIRHSCDIVRQKNMEAQNQSLWKALTTGLAIFGGISLLNSMGTDEEYYG